MKIITKTMIPILIILSLISTIACHSIEPVTFKVTGDSEDVTITYSLDNGDVTIENVSLPWELTIEYETFNKNISAYIKACNNDEFATWIYATIEADFPHGPSHSESDNCVYAGLYVAD
ncbi:MAG: hypothetical protein GY754_42440 [bacterium]|nr:hypothetical protein [bacterium]